MDDSFLPVLVSWQGGFNDRSRDSPLDERVRDQPVDIVSLSKDCTAKLLTRVNIEGIGCARCP
jgi:hypothetical protein